MPKVHYEVEATVKGGQVESLSDVYSNPIFTSRGSPIEFDTEAAAFEALGRWRARMPGSVGAWPTRVIRVETGKTTRAVVDPRDG